MDGMDDMDKMDRATARAAPTGSAKTSEGTEYPHSYTSGTPEGVERTRFYASGSFGRKIFLPYSLPRAMSASTLVPRGRWRRVPRPARASTAGRRALPYGQYGRYGQDGQGDCKGRPYSLPRAMSAPTLVPRGTPEGAGRTRASASGLSGEKFSPLHSSWTGWTIWTGRPQRPPPLPLCLGTVLGL